MGNLRRHPTLWPPGLHPQAGSGRAKGGRAYAIPSPPVQDYGRIVPAPIADNGTAQGLIGGGGTLTLAVGPQGLGTIWRPNHCVIATSTGASDNSTAQIFVGPQAIQSLLRTQSYAGGGDEIGLHGIVLAVGHFVWVKWIGGNPGDTATLAVVGSQSVLAE
jgi:hypothetical protein